MSTVLTWTGIALAAAVALAALTGGLYGLSLLLLAGRECHYDEWPADPDHHPLPVPEDMS